MRKILFFYRDGCEMSLEIKKRLQKDYSESHELRIAQYSSNTFSYFLKHDIKKTPTIVMLNYKDRELKRQENITLEELTTFIK